MLEFHACPPSGEWLNDPNGLVRVPGGWRLFAQHRADAPDFRATGWASFFTADLLDWRWEGPVIPPAADAWAYSGSVRHVGDRLEAWHTEHVAGLEGQVRRRSFDSGATWSEPDAALGPMRRDWRDPFIFSDGGADYMLVAAPCPWTDDGSDARSRIEVFISRDDGAAWEPVGAIGPWSPARVLWETPSLVRDEHGGWILMVALVDRREGASVSVRRWRGALRRGVFERADPADDEGAPVDCGPDFYAAAPNAASKDDPDNRLFLGWASSWDTARRFPWPGFKGGPISLPRRLTLRGSAPAPATVGAFRTLVADAPRAGLGVATVPGGFDLTIEGAGAALTVAFDPARGLDVERSGAGLDWKRRFSFGAERGPRALSLFVDGQLVELHIAPDDLWVTAGVPAEGPFRIRMNRGALAWRVRG